MLGCYISVEPYLDQFSLVSHRVSTVELAKEKKLHCRVLSRHGPHVLSNVAAFWVKQWMSNQRQLSLGVAGGGFSSLLFQLLQNWPESPVISPALTESVGHILECQCSWLSGLDLSEREIGIFLVGLTVGIFLLPILELLLILRQAWTVWIRGKLLGSSSFSGKQLYRVV